MAKKRRNSRRKRIGETEIGCPSQGKESAYPITHGNQSKSIRRASIPILLRKAKEDCDNFDVKTFKHLREIFTGTENNNNNNKNNKDKNNKNKKLKENSEEKNSSKEGMMRLSP